MKSIEEPKVSFKIAKLLKEKGINIPSIECYDENGKETLDIDSEAKELYYSPTLGLVITNLYYHYALWLYAFPFLNSERIMQWICRMRRTKSNENYFIENEETWLFDSYSEAIEEGITYILENENICS